MVRKLPIPIAMAPAFQGLIAKRCRAGFASLREFLNDSAELSDFPCTLTTWVQHINMTKHPTPETNSQSTRSADGSTNQPGTLAGQSSAKSSAQSSAPDPQAIAARAYQKYLEGGEKHGNDVENWTKAEQELLAEMEQKKEETPARSDRSNTIKTATETGLSDHLTLQ